MTYRDIKAATHRVTMQEKIDHVRRSANLEPLHTCHWPGCPKRVKPSVWGCRSHWYTLPIDLRNAIWKAYRPGQEVSKTPSAQYVAAAKAVQDWIARNYPPRPA